jgi:hypothetical protein
MSIVTHATLSQAADATAEVNRLAARPTFTDVKAIRIADHADDTSDYVLSSTPPTPVQLEGMAIFVSAQYGKPWIKKGGLAHVVQQNGVDTVTDKVTTLFPNYDYSTFE